MYRDEGASLLSCEKTPDANARTIMTAVMSLFIVFSFLGLGRKLDDQRTVIFERHHRQV
jgi:hypothetical protein